jgi:hypothetical protein
MNSEQANPCGRSRPGAAALSIAALALMSSVSQAADTSPAQQLDRWSAQAGAPGRAERGRTFFTSPHGSDWSCASCHGNPPTGPGKHAGTGKGIEPMAPAANPRAFTDTATTAVTSSGANAAPARRPTCSRT